MYKRVHIKKLGKKKAHRESMIRTQIRTLFSSGFIKTTTPKAKAVKSAAQSLLSNMDSKEISLDTTRKINRILGNKKLVEKAFKYVKNETYGVRIRKVGFRAGDNSEESKVELIGYDSKKKRKSDSKEKEIKEDVKKAEVGRKANKDIDEKKVKKTGSGKSSKAERKSTQIARTRAGL